MKEQKESGYSNMGTYFVLFGDLVILNLILYLSSINNSDIINFGISLKELCAVSSICYLLSGTNTRVILFRRKVRAFQIISNVMKNLVIFTILLMIIYRTSQKINFVSADFAFLLISLYISIIVYMLILRALVKKWRTSGKNLQHTVIVGDSYNSVELYHEIADEAAAGFKVHGYFAHNESDAFPPECKYLGKPETAIEWLKGHSYVSHLFCSLPSAEKDTILPIIHYCENNLVNFYSLPNLHNYLHNRVYFNMMGNVPYLSLRQNPLSMMHNRFIKRTFDLCFSTLFLCTLFPIIFIIVAIITKTTMPGPIFFKQKRNGLNDKEFYCYKFRSMKVNADADKVQATKDDPRKTKWGNIMRKTSIDELPQFINVFKGEMSVVGPRPHMVKHTEEYSKLIDKYMVRHFVKPGITGWSQVTGFRGETKELKDMEGRIKGDIWYIEHWNFWLDIYIIYKTVANAIHGEKNAY